MGAGKYRHRVSVQSPTYTQDARGASERTWTTVGARWARVEELRGNESLDERGVSSSLSHRVTMRYYSDLTVKDRIVWGTRTIEIISVLNPDGMRKETVCECAEVL